ncbi:MAG: acetyl-CoA carboxylase biotin carboxyl carrier protein [Candidatus Aminicenantes bacterium]|nr:acetyl-CoA carboxylase biotin carboxyl carrier protein [Candidatus Aminicenantes bacterium]
MNAKINYEEILKLIGLLEEKNLSQFELEVEGFKIKIARSLPAAPQTTSLVFQERRMGYPSGPAAPAAAAVPAAPEETGLHFVTSPMVGTFYRAPSPTSPPFVEVGDQVKKSQTLCIVEAMKLMNEIDADIDGIVKDIYIENAKPVEYGAKLFAIRPL